MRSAGRVVHGAGGCASRTGPTAAASQAAAPAQAGRDRRRRPIAYTYEPDGRRDPFLNLLGTGIEPRATKRGGDGPAGMSVERGVGARRDAEPQRLIAMVQGPDNRTYIVHQGDKLARRHDQEHHRRRDSSSFRKSTIRCRS